MATDNLSIVMHCEACHHDFKISKEEKTLIKHCPFCNYRSPSEGAWSESKNGIKLARQMSIIDSSGLNPYQLVICLFLEGRCSIGIHDVQKFRGSYSVAHALSLNDKIPIIIFRESTYDKNVYSIICGYETEEKLMQVIKKSGDLWENDHYSHNVQVFDPTKLVSPAIEQVKTASEFLKFAKSYLRKFYQSQTDDYVVFQDWMSEALTKAKLTQIDETSD